MCAALNPPLSSSPPFARISSLPKKSFRGFLFPFSPHSRFSKFARYLTHLARRVSQFSSYRLCTETEMFFTRTPPFFVRPPHFCPVPPFTSCPLRQRALRKRDKGSNCKNDFGTNCHVQWSQFGIAFISDMKSDSRSGRCGKFG